MAESKSQSARAWFETMYGAGKGVAEGLEAAAKKRAGAALTAAQNQAIPTPDTPDQLTANYEGQGGGIAAQDFEAGNVQPQINLKYGGDLEGFQRRKREALNEYAQYSTPEEMVLLEEKYLEKNKRDYQQGLQYAADLIDQEATPEVISQALTNAYALDPSGISGVATPSPGGGVAMSFFDEVTGKVYATAPINDSKKLRLMAAGVDDPKYRLEFGLKEADLADQVKRTRLMDKELKDNIAKNKAGAAASMLELEAKNLQAVSTAIGSMNKKLVERGDKAYGQILSATKERPMPDAYNGDYAQYLANATGFMVENPGYSPGEALRMTEMINEKQLAVAYDIMNQNRDIEFDPATQRVPPEVMAQAYQQMALPGGPIKKQTDTETGEVSHVYMDGKNPIRLPSVITGEGRPNTRIGLMNNAYQAQAAMGLRTLSDAERKSLKQVVFDYAGAKVDEVTGEITGGGIVGIGGGAIPEKGTKGEQKETKMTPDDEKNILALADKIMAQGDSGSKNMAKLLMNVQQSFGDTAAMNISAVIAQRMDQLEKQGGAPAPAAQAAPAAQGIPPSGPGPAYAPAGTQPVDPLGGIKSAYRGAQQGYREAGVNPQAVAIPQVR